jgi:hypothetical protein
MTNEIKKLKEDIAILQQKLEALEKIDESRTDVEKAYRDAYGHYPETSGFAATDWDAISWEAFQKGYDSAQPKEFLVEEPTKPMDEVVNRLVKKYQAQKLFNRLVDELGYDFDACNDIVDLVEDWIVDEQSSAGSQNVNTELLVDGFNDCVRKMKEMLR